MSRRLLRWGNLRNALREDLQALSVVTALGRKSCPEPAAQYVAKYAEANFLWDELAAVAWLDPTIITNWKKLYLDVDTDHGANYGNTLVWPPGRQPALGEILAEVRDDLDKQKFYREYVDLLSRPTPNAKK